MGRNRGMSRHRKGPSQTKTRRPESSRKGDAVPDAACSSASEDPDARAEADRHETVRVALTVTS